MKLRLDYDKYTFRIVDAFYMLKSIPAPYLVRISASGEGLHIAKEGDYAYDDPLYINYDDPRRLRMNRIRQRAGVSHNLLWDVKKGKRPGPWHTIENIVDILAFACKLYELRINRKSYISPPLSKARRQNRKMKRKDIDAMLEIAQRQLEYIELKAKEEGLDGLQDGMKRIREDIHGWMSGK